MKPDFPSYNFPVRPFWFTPRKFYLECIDTVIDLVMYAGYLEGIGYSDYRIGLVLGKAWGIQHAAELFANCHDVTSLRGGKR